MRGERTAGAPPDDSPRPPLAGGSVAPSPELVAAVRRGPASALRRDRALSPSRWSGALLRGATIGTVILGAGGRLAMRGVTLWEGRTHLFSVAGSITVLAWGAGLGAAAGLLRVGLEASLRSSRAEVSRWVRALPVLLWWVAGVAIALVLLTPWTRARLVLFPPVVLAFLAAFEISWRHRARADVTASMRGDDAAA